MSSLRVERLRRDLPLARLLGQTGFVPTRGEAAAVDAEAQAFVRRFLEDVQAELNTDEQEAKHHGTD